MGNLKGVGRIYQQTFVDTYSKLALVKLYDRKHAITAADMLNDRKRHLSTILNRVSQSVRMVPTYK